MKSIYQTLALAFLFIFSPISIYSLQSQKTGIQLYSLRNQFKKDIPGTLGLISSWGLTKLEGGSTYGMDLKEFQGLLKKNNLSVVSVGAGFGDLEKNPQKVVDLAKAYGAKYVMCA